MFRPSKERREKQKQIDKKFRKRKKVSERLKMERIYKGKLLRIYCQAFDTGNNTTFQHRKE